MLPKLPACVSVAGLLVLTVVDRTILSCAFTLESLPKLWRSIDNLRRLKVMYVETAIVGHCNTVMMDNGLLPKFMVDGSSFLVAIAVPLRHTAERMSCDPICVQLRRHHRTVDHQPMLMQHQSFALNAH